MARWKLQEGCLFVDAYNLDKLDKHGNKILRKDQGFPYTYAHIMDKRPGKAEKVIVHENDRDVEKENYPCTLLNDFAGFIAGFIVMGVDTGLIPQIVHSEFGMDVHTAASEVQGVLNGIQQYLEERKKASYTGGLKAILPGGEKHLGKYDLDFNVNPVGNVRIKYGGRI